MAEKKQQAKTSTGLSRNVEAALAYVLGWVSGLILLLVEKEDKFVRFHAMQSVATFALFTVVSFVPLIGWILTPFVAILSFVTWLVCIFKAYQGEEFKLPVVGEWAKKQVG